MGGRPVDPPERPKLGHWGRLKGIQYHEMLTRTALRIQGGVIAPSQARSGAGAPGSSELTHRGWVTGVALKNPSTRV